MTQPAPTPKDQAAWELLEAKRREDEARAYRLDCETKLIELVGLKDEGSQTAKTGFFKITTTAAMIRSLVPNGLGLIAREGAEVMDTVIRMKPEISVSGLKALAHDHPDIYGRILPAIVTRPSKPTVKVELLKEAA